MKFTHIKVYKTIFLIPEVVLPDMLPHERVTFANINVQPEELKGVDRDAVTQHIQDERHRFGDCEQIYFLCNREHLGADSKTHPYKFEEYFTDDN